MGDLYRNVPERRRENGVRVHKLETVIIGDKVEAIRFVQGMISKGTRLKISDILVEPRGNQRGFEVRLVFSEFPGEDFNPKRFRKIS